MVVCSRSIFPADYQREASARKFQLFGVACCRILWKELSIPARNLVKKFEQFADNQLSEQQVHEQRKPHSLDSGYARRSVFPRVLAL